MRTELLAVCVPQFVRAARWPRSQLIAGTDYPAPGISGRAAVAWFCSRWINPRPARSVGACQRSRRPPGVPGAGAEVFPPGHEHLLCCTRRGGSSVSLPTCLRVTTAHFQGSIPQWHWASQPPELRGLKTRALWGGGSFSGSSGSRRDTAERAGEVAWHKSEVAPSQGPALGRHQPWARVGVSLPSCCRTPCRHRCLCPGGAHAASAGRNAK